MKFDLIGGAVLILGLPVAAFAGGVSSPMVPHTGIIISGNHGPQTLNTNTNSSLTNNGTITGGSSAGVTVTGSNPGTVTNNGTITSSTVGITSSGTSTTIQNSGSIIVKSTSNGSSSNAVGVSQ
jgi:hypothetical protein